MSTPQLAVDVRGISKVYRLYPAPLDRLKEALHPFRKKYHTEFTALENITFQVHRGETVGIVGRNGAGKSTLLKIITGVLSPTAGSVGVCGKISSLLELGTGFNPELSGIENAYFNGLLLNIPKEEMDRKIQSIIEFADIGDFINQPVKIYSSGMFSRLAFAVAFHVDPDILIVDEALSVGDMSFQKKCFDKFHEIRERGCTILFVSHDPFQVKGYCQRALYLKNGRCVAFGSSADVVDAYMHDQEQEIAERRALKQSEEPRAPVAAAAQSRTADMLIQITDVAMLGDDGTPTSEVTTGDTVRIRFSYKIAGHFDGALSFVFNVYRHDGFYVCGATSVMDKLPPFPAKPRGTVTVEFPALPLLAGNYKWRVAVNDSQGLGIFTEAVPVCEFRVRDNFESVGMVNLARKWSVE